MMFNDGDVFFSDLGVSFSEGDLIGCWNASMIFNVGELFICASFGLGGVGVTVSLLFCC